MALDVDVATEPTRCIERQHSPEKVPQPGGKMLVYCPACGYQRLRHQRPDEVAFSRAYREGKAAHQTASIPLPSGLIDLLPAVWNLKRRLAAQHLAFNYVDHEITLIEPKG